MGCTYSKDSVKSGVAHKSGGGTAGGRKSGRTSNRDSRAATPRTGEATAVRPMHSETRGSPRAGAAAYSAASVGGGDRNRTPAVPATTEPFQSATSSSVNGGAGGASAQPPQDELRALRRVVADAEEVLESLNIPRKEKELIALSFVNTLADVLRQTYRLKREALQSAIEDLCSGTTASIHNSVASRVTHGAREEFLNHLIASWTARNPEGEPFLPADLANEVLIENQITPWKSEPMRFADCYRELLRIGDNSFANSVFARYAEGNLTITSEQFLKFLTECQRSDTATMKVAEEKTKERFGAVGTRFTFALYLQSLTLNTAQDPRRGGTVHQDMTQPLPQYAVRTAHVETMEDLTNSLATGVRALVLRCHDGDGSERSEVMAGEAPLEEVLHVVKEEGFAASNYPLILCLAPEVALSVPLQKKIAKLLSGILGDELLAKGMMFDGATITDPKFSPAALQHKVLVLAPQAPLKPFVGFLVADMNRNGLGVKVTSVVSHTPAAKAGVQTGDWFTHINNEQISNKSHLKSILATLELGQSFTMRKENLDDVTIVVGGMAQGDEENAVDLSALAFLRYAPEAETNAPWDVCVSDPKKPCGDRILSSPTATATEAAALSRAALSSHFRFTTLRGPSPHEAIGAATRAGVQFICATRSTEDQKWSRGFFTDNGSCGYIQKATAATMEPLSPSASGGYSIEIKCPPPHFYNWSIAGLRGAMFGKGSLEVDEDSRTVKVSGADELTVCSFLVTLMPPTAEAARTAAHLVPISPVRAKAEAIAKPIVLSVSFPVSILRCGIRAFDSVEEKDEGKFSTMPHYPILAEISAL